MARHFDGPDEPVDDTGEVAATLHRDPVRADAGHSDDYLRGDDPRDSEWESNSFDDDSTDSNAPKDTVAGTKKKASKKRSAAPSRSRWALIGMTAGGILVAILLGWFTGLLAGKVFGPADPAAAKPGSSSPSTQATATGEGDEPGQSIKIVGATLFDPPPGDGQENPDRINLSYDGQPGTTWPTLQYKSTAKFGNIKPGVGIIYDLGSPKTISAVQITTTLPGAVVEIRTGAGDTGTLDQFAVAAGPVTLESTTNIPLPAGTESQYVLVWITTLVPQQNFYQASISEVSILS